MVSSVNNTQLPQFVNLQPAKHPPQPAASPSGTPTDSVQLSAAAQKAASGDVDHDGDSH
jgi:hypothetical protein